MSGREWLTMSWRTGTLMLGLACLAALPARSEAAGRRVEPGAIVPIERLAPERRDDVVEVIRDYSFHRQGKPETFPCNPRIYLSLLNDPILTLSLWKDLGDSPANLRRMGPNVYEGTDGSGTTASWEYVYRSPRQHVLFSRLTYVGPKGNHRLEGRIVLVVRSGFYKEVNGESWVQHDIQAFVKIDSKGWKAVAATLRPVIERLLADQVQEAGWFVSLMARLVEMYPSWAETVVTNLPQLEPEARKQFRELVVQTRRPGALAGRPRMIDADPNATVRR